MSNDPFHPNEGIDNTQPVPPTEPPAGSATTGFFAKRRHECLPGARCSLSGACKSTDTSAFCLSASLSGTSADQFLR